ncbi:hypothetical protein ACH4OW_31970 [Streptomyces sp. NPDC017056]|uniref:hypothetical protein n=1 Tax=Streptomyces sp. NPDC017056 TaxID=3364973 RepID=UPI00378E7B07
MAFVVEIVFIKKVPQSSYQGSAPCLAGRQPGVTGRRKRTATASSKSASIAPVFRAAFALPTEGS